MMHDAATQITIALRIAVAVTWMIVGWWGIPSLWRAAIGTYTKSDMFFGSLTLLSIGLLIFQFRSLATDAPLTSDKLTMTGLLSLLLSGIGIFVARSFNSPEGHKRAMLLSHLTIVCFCLAAGALS